MQSGYAMHVLDRFNFKVSMLWEVLDYHHNCHSVTMEDHMTAEENCFTGMMHVTDTVNDIDVDLSEDGHLYKK